MSYTYQELLEKLKREEETVLLEVLSITSEDLVDRFDDIIEKKIDMLFEEYEINSEDEEHTWDERF